RDGPEGWPVQRDRAGEAAEGDPDADARDEGREAVSRLCGAGRRLAGSEPVAVLSECGGIRDDGAGGGGGPEHQQLSDAVIVRDARVGAGANAGGDVVAGFDEGGVEEDGVYAGVRAADVGADQCDTVRHRASLDVGRVEQSWGGLWGGVVRGQSGREKRWR